jgi:hypothetical protein
VAAGSTEPSAGTFSGRFGTGAQFAPGSSSPPLDNPSLSAPPAGAAGDERNVRRLVRVNPKVEIGSFDPTARAALPNEVPASNPPASFDDRFGNWTSSPAASAPLTPYGPLSPPQTTRPVGLITGQPMPNIALPPSVFGLPELERADWKRRQ